MICYEITGGTVRIDEADFALVSGHRWYVKGGYAYSEKMKRGVVTRIAMHRLILGLAPHERGDHRDGDGLNNVRANLRRATVKENNRNSRAWAKSRSGYKGVNERPHGVFRSRITVDGKRRHLGDFATAEAAARSYDAAAVKYFGEFAWLNFPNGRSRGPAPLRALRPASGPPLMCVNYKGEDVFLVDLCRRLGADRNIVYGRLVLGWDIERALSEPVKRRSHQPKALVGSQVL